MPSGVYIRNNEYKEKLSLRFLGKNNPSYIHGMTNTRFYNIYNHIKKRCKDKKWKDHHLYYNKGIKNNWVSFADFKRDMYKSYLEHAIKYGEINTSIDRIDSNGNYCKENCRWATPRVQANNTSRNKFVTINGENKTISQWSRIFKIDADIIFDRINKLGWEEIKAIITPPRKLKRK